MRTTSIKKSLKNVKRILNIYFLVLFEYNSLAYKQHIPSITFRQNFNEFNQFDYYRINKQRKSKYM